MLKIGHEPEIGCFSGEKPHLGGVKSIIYRNASDEACVCSGRVEVWKVESMRRNGVPVSVIMQAHPSLDVEGLIVAIQYARRNPEEINKAIKRFDERMKA